MIVEQSASTLGEYFECVKAIRRNWNPSRSSEEIWFRGQSRKKYSLLPGLYRQDSIDAEFSEEDLIERFKALAASRPGTPAIDRDWEWYFLAQHYGLPTRLLDWTESALTALFFAICEGIEARDPAEVFAEANAARAVSQYGDESPTVWMLDAGTLNRLSFGPNSDEVLAMGGVRTKHYLTLESEATEFEWRELKVSNQFPIAVLAARQSPRIVAQQGTFTVHGFDKRPLEQLAADPDCGIRLARIQFDTANLCQLWDEIELTGISRMVLFPELEYISKYLRWTCRSFS